MEPFGEGARVMESIVATLQARQREQDLAEVDAGRVGIRIAARVGPDASKIDQKLHAIAIEQEAEEARALAARRPVDLIERHVDAGSRSLVAAVEQLGAHRLDLGQVSKDLVAVARQALAVDRALVKIADERARSARASDGG
jgi:3-keto-L-gulonate-6-phosphate decarboxylase